jgi:hypothetical protein
MHGFNRRHVLPAHVPETLQTSHRCPQVAQGALLPTDGPHDFRGACQAILQGFLSGTIDVPVVSLQLASILKRMRGVAQVHQGAPRLDALIADGIASALKTMVVPGDQREAHVLRNLHSVVWIAEALVA